jgi:hypothetical protein
MTEHKNLFEKGAGFDVSRDLPGSWKSVVFL